MDSLKIIQKENNQEAASESIGHRGNSLFILIFWNDYSY